MMQIKTLFLTKGGSFSTLLSDYLKKYNFGVMTAPALNLDMVETMELILIGLPPQDPAGLDIMKRIRNVFPKNRLPVIVFNVSTVPETIAGYFYYGANDILSESMMPEEIVARIKAQLKLKRNAMTTVFPQKPFKMSDENSRFISLFDEKCVEYSITNKQKEIIRMVAMGKVNKEIADSLGIASKTVGRHLENIYFKCGVRNRAQLVSSFFTQYNSHLARDLYSHEL